MARNSHEPRFQSSPAVLSLWWLPALVFLIPFLTVHASYLVAAAHHHVPWCNPYWESCTSISATGRHPPEAFIFKPFMTVSSVLMFFYWQANRLWLRSLGDTGLKTQWAVGLLGVLAPVFLALYATFLGVQGETGYLLRKTGITLSFTFTYLLQLLITGRLRLLVGQGRFGVCRRPAQLVSAMLICLVVLLILGVISLFLDAFYPWYDEVEDAFEWHFALLLNIHTLLMTLLWHQQKTSFRLQ